MKILKKGGKILHNWQDDNRLFENDLKIQERIVEGFTLDRPSVFGAKSDLF